MFSLSERIVSAGFSYLYLLVIVSGMKINDSLIKFFSKSVTPWLFHPLFFSWVKKKHKSFCVYQLIEQSYLIIITDTKILHVSWKMKSNRFQWTHWANPQAQKPTVLVFFQVKNVNLGQIQPSYNGLTWVVV